MLLQPTASTVLLTYLVPLVFAGFTHNDRVCWGRSCVIRTDAGTLCFEPHDNGIGQQECTDSFLKILMQVHLTSTTGRSILYYDNNTRVLGAATWVIPPTMASPVFVCMTGRRMDDPKQYRTICREARGNDDMEADAAHARECVADQKPRHVSDGCFSVGKSAGGDDNHKEWYEQPIVAGFFWVLGAFLTLGSIYLLGGKAMRAVQARLARRLVVPAVRVERSARGWPVLPLPTQQPAIILQHPYASGTVLRPETFVLTDRATTRPSRPVGEEVKRD